MSIVPSSYQTLQQTAREIALLNGASAVLGWDQETYMPERGIEHRSRILSHLSGLAHEAMTSKKFEEELLRAEEEVAHAEPTSPFAANVAEWRREFDRATKVPSRLIKEQSAAISLGQAAWSKARAQSDFKQFQEPLKKLIDLTAEIAQRWAGESNPYDALLDQHERGITAKEIDQLFSQLRPEVAKIAREAVERSQKEAPPASLLQGDCPIEKQQTLNREIAESIGFDFTAGRIDTTAHPFCSGFGPGDVRLTTRYDSQDFTSSLFGILHEAGHGLYEQGLLESEWGLPSGCAVSLGIHESQSRLWENHVGRSRTFWEKWYPRAVELFPHLRDVTLDQFLLGINRAEYSFIRVEADEATYDLHIMLRFSLEKRLFDGTLKVEEIPDAWNDEFKASFGMTPPDDARGCLQDIHWSMGGFGYFPTYTLGNLNSAQIFKAANQESEIHRGIQQAQYEGLLKWLNRHIHAPGSIFAPSELLTHATGSPTRIQPYLSHLRTRFLGAS